MGLAVVNDKGRLLKTGSSFEMSLKSKDDETESDSSLAEVNDGVFAQLAKGTSPL
jgi:hypothetical protein